jgi:hypothetical protein
MTVPNAESVTPAANVGDVAVKADTTVAREAFDQVLSEKKKIQKQLEEMKATQKAAEEAELARKGEIQKLLDLQKQRADDYEKKLSDMEGREKDRKKLGAIVSSLGSQVEDKWFSVIGSHIDDIVIDEATGKPDPLSVSKVVENLKKTWPEMSKPNPVGMPNGAPAGNGATTIARSEWLKLSSKKMLEWGPKQIID